MAAKRAALAKELLVRAVKLAHHPHVRLPEVRERFGLSERALRDARKALAVEARWTEDDLVLAALHEQPRGVAPSAIVEFIDWVDHSRWSENELATRLESLRASGAVVEREGRWCLARPWP